MHYINITFDVYNFGRISVLVKTQLKMEVPMKIAYFIDTYSPEANGGIRMRVIDKGIFKTRLKSDNSRNGLWVNVMFAFFMSADVLLERG